MDLPLGPHHGSTRRAFDGCWTCRLRRKKCDGKHPVCDACTALHITCHFYQDKPEWMDGGVKQEEMAEQFKREVKENAHRRPVRPIATDGLITPPSRLSGDMATSRCNLLDATPNVYNHGMEPLSKASTIWPQRGADCTLTGKVPRERIAFGRSDTVLLMFYLDHVLPFLFPFYRPSYVQGGRAWILEMMVSSPVVREATLCQSSYFFSLTRGTTDSDIL
jgi:C6 transcription factor Pro1